MNMFTRTRVESSKPEGQWPISGRAEGVTGQSEASIMSWAGDNRLAGVRCPVCGQQVDTEPPGAVQCGLHGCRGKWNYLVVRSGCRFTNYLCKTWRPLVWSTHISMWHVTWGCQFSSVASVWCGWQQGPVLPQCPTHSVLISSSEIIKHCHTAITLIQSL